MNWKRTLTDILKNGCVIFTCITIGVYALGTLLSSKEHYFIPTFRWIVLFLLFSLLLGAANRLLFWKRIAPSLRLLIHFLAALAIYVTAVVFCGGFYKSGAAALLAMIVFLILYAISALIFFLCTRRSRNAENQKKEYETVFH